MEPIMRFPGWLTLVLVGACSSVNSPTGPGACNPTGGMDCANTINAIVLPMLAHDGVHPQIAPDSELCRRYSIDLTGVAPTWEEYQQNCAGRTPAQMVDYFMGQPGYVQINQRLWADALQYDNRIVWYPYIQDLDAQVGKLHRGELAYPDFAAIAVTHPGFIGKFVGENVVAYAFLAFLGRDALPEERQDLLGLYRMWKARPNYDPMLTRFRYNACTTDADCATGRTCITMVCQSTTNYRELYIDPRPCAGNLGEVFCSSPMHNVHVQLAGTQPMSLDQLAPSDWQVLQTPGRVLTTLPYFWEAAVDNVLHKYLGWWHGGVELPGYEIPEVRQALALFFQQKSGDMRALEREVLLSALYLMAAQEPQGDTKWWHYGPTKQMIAEVWLDSVAKFAGVGLGTCDWRFPNLTPRWLPPALVPPRGPIAGFDYQHESRVMGGCPDQEAGFRYTDVGVLAEMEQRTILGTVCGFAGATAFLPAAGADKTKLIADLFRRAFTAAPGDEAASLASGLPAADAPTARNLCQAMLRSGRFLFY